jgi:multisubunit Na+/H+ antiporter MnhE subunit
VTALVVRAVGLVAIYLLVLTSVAPGDILVGAVVAAGLVVAGSRADAPARRSGIAAWGRWLVAVGRLSVATAREIAVGTVRVVRFCLAGTGHPGFVEIPRGDRSREAVALWGLITGEAPDEYPVAIDDERGVLIVHNLEADNPDGTRARHAAARERLQGPVVR